MHLGDCVERCSGVPGEHACQPGCEPGTGRNASAALLSFGIEPLESLHVLDRIADRHHICSAPYEALGDGVVMTSGERNHADIAFGNRAGVRPLDALPWAQRHAGYLARFGAARDDSDLEAAVVIMGAELSDEVGPDDAQAKHGNPHVSAVPPRSPHASHPPEAARPRRIGPAGLRR